jgi:hypothetical protein
MSCKYCKNKNQNRPIIRVGDEYARFDISITKGNLELTGFYDSIRGIEPAEAKIYYCPMCGRELK